MFHEVVRIGQGIYTRINDFQENLIAGRPNDWHCRAGPATCMSVKMARSTTAHSSGEPRDAAKSSTRFRTSGGSSTAKKTVRRCARLAVCIGRLRWTTFVRLGCFTWFRCVDHPVHPQLVRLPQVLLKGLPLSQSTLPSAEKRLVVTHCQRLRFVLRASWLAGSPACIRGSAGLPSRRRPSWSCAPISRSFCQSRTLPCRRSGASLDDRRARPTWSSSSRVLTSKRASVSSTR